MPMNKKEREEFEAMKQALRIARAMRFTTPVAPDVPPPKGSGSTSGWLHNSYRGAAIQAWSESVSHGLGGPDRKSTGGGSQNSRPLFSTELLALKAMRHEMEMDFAKKLAQVDRLIEEVEASDAKDC